MLSKKKIAHIIFETNTPLSKGFDVALLVFIATSILVVMLESVSSIRIEYQTSLRAIEWFLTIIFTLEYAVRIWVAHNKKKYIFSFYGMVDLFSILPTYLSLYFVGAHSLLVIRALRLLRIFRVLKLVQFVGEGNELTRALRDSKYKIIVFLWAILTIVLIVGTLMYLIEGPENGFESIPQSVYWAIVTMTTVGYGDISPQTPLGQLIASLMMILGYGIIAVPTGIVTAEMTRGNHQSKEESDLTCLSCGHHSKDKAAKYCSACGERIEQN